MATIAAIATAQAPGGVGMIRISGEQALCIADKVFQAADHTPLVEVKGYRAKYGAVYHKREKVDEAVALVFRAPHSYTGEDIVELSCHGGLYLLKTVLRAVFEAGAVPAQAGEFTKRAYLNGKMDLTQAEAVMKLISAGGEQAARAALTVHDGAMRKKLDQMKENLLFCASHMAAWVDYPDEEIPELSEDVLRQKLQETKNGLEKLLSQFDQGKAVTEGVDTVIAGRPNAGKSTLMNLLSGRERSIVTSVAGTTRDVVEETVQLGNLLLRLADTAGLRQAEDEVETIGIEMARDRVKKADFLLAVFDASLPLNEEDEALLELCKNRPAVAVINKTDLSVQIETERIAQAVEHIVEISAANGDGLEALTRKAEQVLGTREFDPSLPLLFGERQRQCCKRGLECTAEALDALHMGMTMDAINVSIDGAVDALLELSGEKALEAVVDEVFSHFCVGK